MKTTLFNEELTSSGIERTRTADDKSQLWTKALEDLLRTSLHEAASINNGEERNAIIESLICRIRDSVLCELAKYHEAEKQVISVLHRWYLLKPETPMPGWQFNRRVKKYPKETIQVALLNLQKRKQIKVEKIINNRKAGLLYSLFFNVVK